MNCDGESLTEEDIEKRELDLYFEMSTGPNGDARLEEEFEEICLGLIIFGQRIDKGD